MRTGASQLQLRPASRGVTIPVTLAARATALAPLQLGTAGAVAGGVPTVAQEWLAAASGALPGQADVQARRGLHLLLQRVFLERERERERERGMSGDDHP